MHAFFLLGCLFLVITFVGLIAETMAHVRIEAEGLLLSAYDVWYTLWPGSLVVTQIRIERWLGPWVWDPFIVKALALPVWILFGVPGATLFWFFRPPGGKGPTPEEEESLFLYDELVKQAKEDGEFDDAEPPFRGDDMGADFVEIEAELRPDAGLILEHEPEGGGEPDQPHRPDALPAPPERDEEEPR